MPPGPRRSPGSPLSRAPESRRGRPRREAARRRRRRDRAAADGSTCGVHLRGTRAKAIALLAVLQLTASLAAAQGAGIDRLFPAEPVGYVNDFASVVDAGSAAAMEDLITRLRSATGA